MTKTDELYMRRCLQLAACGRQQSRPNPMVGAVVVAPAASGDHAPARIIGEGYHIRCGEGHAEVNAFASVRPADEHLLPQSTLYVSLEPCSHHGKTPPCCDLIIRKGIRRVVVGCIDDFAAVQGRGIRRLREAGIDVVMGVLEQECRQINRRFFTYHRQHRPYIILKWAESNDGFLDDHGHPAAFSTPFTRLLVHKLRSQEDAILVGRTTWEREHPQLNVRHWAGRTPARFMLSASTKEENDASAENRNTRDQQPQRGCTPETVASIDKLLATCYDRQLQSLIVEGGRQTLQAFLDRELWDEIRIETANATTCFGGTRAPQPPSKARLMATETYDGNTISHYVKP